MFKRVLKTAIATIVSLSMVAPGVIVFADDDPPAPSEATIDEESHDLTSDGYVSEGSNVNSTDDYDVDSNSGTIATVTEGSFVTNNNGNITTNNGSVSNNAGNIETNGGTVENNLYVDRATKTQPDEYHEKFYYYEYSNDQGIQENNSTIETNKGFVGTNNGTINESSGTFASNSQSGDVEYAVINENSSTGTVKENKSLSTIEANNGTVENNRGEINRNSGTVVKNMGDIDSNGVYPDDDKSFHAPNGYAGTVKENGGTIASNTATVEVNGITVNGETSGFLRNNSGQVNENKGSIGYQSITGTTTVNNGKITENSGRVTTNNGTIEENTAEDMEHGKTAGVIVLNTADAVVTVNGGEVINNKGTVKNNYGTVVNSNDGVVEVNFGGYVSGGTVKINLGDDGETSNTNILKQMWQVVSSAWNNLVHSANTSDYYAESVTDKDVKMWLWEDGSMVIKSSTSDALSSVKIKNGSEGTATITDIGNGQWRITNITGNVELETVFGKPASSDPSTPSQPSVTPEDKKDESKKEDKKDEKKNEDKKDENKQEGKKEETKPTVTTPLVVGNTTPIPVTTTDGSSFVIPASQDFKYSWVSGGTTFTEEILLSNTASLPDNQIVIGFDNEAYPVTTSAASSEQTAKAVETAKSAIGDCTALGSYVFSAPYSTSAAATGTTSLNLKESGVQQGERIYIMVTRADGTVEYIPYVVKKSGVISVKIAGLEKGGMVTILKTGTTAKQKPEPKKPRKKAGGGGIPRGKGQPNAPQTHGDLKS